MLLLRDRGDDLAAAGIRPFGISRDSPWSHASWATTLGVANVPLLSDWNGEAIHGLEITREFRGFRGVARRSSFLVDQKGTIRGAWAYDDSEVPDLDVLLAAAKVL